MKVKVVIPFRDKVTQKLYDTNAVMNVSATRYQEIKKHVVKI